MTYRKACDTCEIIYSIIDNLLCFVTRLTPRVRCRNKAPDVEIRRPKQKHFKRATFIIFLVMRMRKVFASITKYNRRCISFRFTKQLNVNNYYRLCVCLRYA